MRDLAERILPVYQKTTRALSRESVGVAARRGQLHGSVCIASVAARPAAEHGCGTARWAQSDTRPIRPCSRYRGHRGLPFAQAFTQVYKDTIQKLNDLDAFAVMGWFATPLVTFQDAVQRTFDQSRPKGDIKLADAVDLVQAYASFDAHRNFGPLVDAFDAEDEQRRYATEDDVLIRMKDDVNIAAIVIRPRLLRNRCPRCSSTRPTSRWLRKGGCRSWLCRSGCLCTRKRQEHRCSASLSA